MAYPILYSFRRCPYAMRARMSIKYANCKVWLREVSLKNKPYSLTDCSPKATVPVLVLADGQILDESLDIMHWALEQSDEAHWLNEQHTKQAAALITQNDTVFKPLLDAYKYPQRTSSTSPLEARDKAFKLLQTLDLQLSNTRFLTGNAIGLADCALMPFIRQFYKVDEGWFTNAGLPHLCLWLIHWLESDLFLQCMKKYPLWQEGEKDTHLL